MPKWFHEPSSFDQKRPVQSQAVSVLASPSTFKDVELIVHSMLGHDGTIFNHFLPPNADREFELNL